MAVKSGFVRSWAAVVERTVQTPGVVPAVYIVKQRLTESSPCRPRLAVDELTLERGEERFGDRVIEAITCATEGESDAVVLGELAEPLTCIDTRRRNGRWHQVLVVAG